MKIIPRSVSRWPKVSWGIAGFVALWALVVVAGRVFTHFTGSDLDTCLFHRVTGYPCPACGTTRGLLAMARGAWGESFAWNPLTMTGVVVGALAMLGRLATAKTLECHFSHQEKRALAILGLALLGLDWAWLIHSHP